MLLCDHHFIDIDECALDLDTCHMNALCNNTIGSYNCTCDDGYEGNGVLCQSKENTSIRTYSMVDSLFVQISMNVWIFSMFATLMPCAMTLRGVIAVTA